jgi:hypothetical protein
MEVHKHPHHVTHKKRWRNTCWNFSCCSSYAGNPETGIIEVEATITELKRTYHMD